MESADLYGPPLVAALCHVNWNFGDGSPPEVVPAGKISPLLLSHAFARKGSFSVFVTAADKDGGVSVAANRVILVQSNLEAWRQQNFGSSANAGAGENSANPMKDGVSNLLKFATGLDPKHPQTMPG